MEGLTTKVIGVRDLLGAQCTSDTHPSPSDTLTRLTLDTTESVLTLPAAGLRFNLKSAPDGLVWWMKGLTIKVIGVRDLLGTNAPQTPIHHCLTPLQDSHYT